MTGRMIAALLGLAAIGACSQEHDATLPGNLQDHEPFAGIGDDEVIKLAGTEPFWGGTVQGGTLTYTTPENMDGQQIEVTRFAGRGGVSFSGETEAVTVDVAVTPGACSDGMSDRIYPFTVTLNWGDEERQGCGWSDVQPFSPAAE